jgi:hypothetical protein
MRLTADSRDHCILLNEEILSALHAPTNSTQLEPGTYVIRIERSSFRCESEGNPASTEPWVLLWIHGGKFINKKTNVSVSATWSSLNGYDDTLTLEVIEPTILCGLLFDTHTANYSGEITLSVLKDC